MTSKSSGWSSIQSNSLDLFLQSLVDFQKPKFLFSFKALIFLCNWTELETAQLTIHSITYSLKKNI